MILKRIYKDKGIEYADIEEVNAVGIEYDKSTTKVKDIHFSIMMKSNLLLEEKGYMVNEEETHYYNEKEEILIVPVIKK